MEFTQWPINNSKATTRGCPALAIYKNDIWCGERNLQIIHKLDDRNLYDYTYHCFSINLRIFDLRDIHIKRKIYMGTVKIIREIWGQFFVTLVIPVSSQIWHTKKLQEKK